MDPFIAQINLVFQIAILIVLSLSLVLKNKKKLFSHGATMLIAVILNTVSFILVMLPSSLKLNYAFNVFSTVTLAHVILGVLAEIFAIWLVVSWRFRSVQYCTRRRKIMRATSALWLMALILGILVYIFLYTNLIS